MMRETSARTLERVKIWRAASLISGRILSSLRRLLPSRMMRLTTGFSLTWMVTAPALLRTWTSANSSVANRSLSTWSAAAWV
jgi:hypothetical protein